MTPTRHKHRATGRPRGRPPSVPFDLDTQIYDVLHRKMNPDTHMVRPQWKELARELGVSRSTISRVMPSLKSAGLIESVLVTSSKNAKFKYVLYKVNDWGRQNDLCGESKETVHPPEKSRRGTPLVPLVS